MPKTSFDKISILGVSIDAVTVPDAITYICNRAVSGQPSGYVIKPYVEFLDRAYANMSLQTLLNGAELSLADGVALLWASHFLYAGPRSLWRFWQTLFAIVLAPGSLTWPLPDRAAGTNFTWPLLQAAARRILRIYLIGSPKNSSIDRTAKALAEAIPGLIITGTTAGHDPAGHPGYVTGEWLEQTSNAVAAARPDIVLVGMGFPLQEKVCAYLAGHVPHGMFIGEGGTFDYEQFGGIRPKAPAWVQHTGLEWLWRLALEPKRIGRQLAIPRFIWRVWRNR